MTAKKTTAKTRDFNEFRAAYDKSFIVPNKIRSGLASLGESWEPEAEFIRRCGLCTTDFARYRDEFMDHVVEVPGKQAKRVWAGTKAYANKLRDTIQ